MSGIVDSFLALSVFWGGAFLGLGIGAIYFINSDPRAALWQRLASSAFGPSLAVLYVVAGLLWPEQYRYKASGVQAYYWLQIIPLLFLLFALARYPGTHRQHYILVPVGLFAWAWTFVLGWVFVHGK